MSVLMWDKPKKRLSTKDWKEAYGFDDGPAGGYQPNMSLEDQQRWKAKITGTKLGFPQVEIRKSFKSVDAVQMLIIVNLGDGYTYKHRTPKDTKGINVHMSLNGGAQMSFQDIQDMNRAIEEAKQALIALKDKAR